jgi:amidase
VLLGGKSADAAIERLIVAEDAFAQADADVAALVRAALARMAAALPAPTPVRVAPDGFDPWREAFRIIQARETWVTFGDFIARRRPPLGPGIEDRMAFAAGVGEADADAARRVHDEARTHIHGLLPPGTVMALPTAPCIAPLCGTPAEALESFRVRVMRLTCIAGLSGLPQVTLPVGTVAGCPVGLSFMGWRGGDEALLDLAVALARYGGLER